MHSWPVSMWLESQNILHCCSGVVNEALLRLSGLRTDLEQDELTSPQAVHLAEVRLPVFLTLGMGLGFSVTTALPSFTVRLPKPPAGSPYSMLRRAICI